MSGKFIKIINKIFSLENHKGFRSLTLCGQSKQNHQRSFKAHWGSLTYYFLFLPAELVEKVHLALFSPQTVLGFTEIKNKRSAFPDVGIKG
jgi:hypothetical protein